MEESKSKGGIALLCDSQGGLLKVLCDDLEVAGQASPGQPWTTLVDRGSLQKALNFSVEVRKKGAAFDWEINILADGSPMSLHVAGAMIDDNMLIVGAKSSEEVMDLYEEMMRISNQQANALRSVLKEQSSAAADERGLAARKERDNALYDEVTRLNNELVTMQRELARKNAELERLNEKARQEIIKRKKAQEALARSNTELEEFAYIASHDLQAPLRKIQAFGERLESKYGEELGDRGLDYLDRMSSAGQRMRKLIDDLLNYSRVTTKAKPFERVDLNAVMEDVIADLQVRIEETGGRVEVSDLPTIDADAVQMRRLLQNLVDNALKFHREGEPPLVKVYGEVMKDEVNICQITVADNGIGFDRKYMEKVFAPFQRLHGQSEYEGTGMGMAICRKIAERHNGQIMADSEPDQGTTFTITLPVRQPLKEAS
jgi:signal transduction histidine kinase